MRPALLLVALFTLGCGAPPAAEVDAGLDAGRLEPCASAEDCDDGLFCTGEERCDVGNPAADERGCIGVASIRCRAGQTCEERERRCVTTCASIRDADGDGADALECGGDDCDDSDPERYPGNTEGCDPDVDRDCDPTTIGAADVDLDGRASLTCGGDDCDDRDMNRFPGNEETCDMVDQDCDPLTFGELDADRDGFVSSACCADSRCGTDCDDSVPSVNPTGTEICNGVDDDCDFSVDEGLDGCMP